MRLTTLTGPTPAGWDRVATGRSTGTVVLADGSLLVTACVARGTSDATEQAIYAWQYGPDLALVGAPVQVAPTQNILTLTDYEHTLAAAGDSAALVLHAQPGTVRTTRTARITATPDGPTVTNSTSTPVEWLVSSQQGSGPSHPPVTLDGRIWVADYAPRFTWWSLDGATWGEIHPPAEVTTADAGYSWLAVADGTVVRVLDTDDNLHSVSTAGWTGPTPAATPGTTTTRAAPSDVNSAPSILTYPAGTTELHALAGVVDSLLADGTWRLTASMGYPKVRTARGVAVLTTWADDVGTRRLVVDVITDTTIRRATASAPTTGTFAGQGRCPPGTHGTRTAWAYPTTGTPSLHVVVLDDAAIYEGILAVDTVDLGWWWVGTRDPSMAYELCVDTATEQLVEIVAGEESLATWELCVSDGLEWHVAALMRPDA